MTLCLIDEDTVRSVLTLDLAMAAVRDALIAQSSADGMAFPVVKERFSDEAAMSLKAGHIASHGVLGVKVAGSWKRNPARGLPTVQASMLLVDPDSGRPVALIAAKTLTTLRTAAAGGVAIDTLARREARVVAVIGSGVQGVAQTRAALAVRPSLREVRCVNPLGPVPEAYWEGIGGVAVQRAYDCVAEAVEGADIVICTTPSTAPLVELEAIAPGTHINAIGADSPGKREIGPRLLSAATRFTDSLAQARRLGEHQHAPELPSRELGAVLAGALAGRERDDEITVFDATGIAFQDLATAGLVYMLARRAALAQEVRWPD